MPIYDYDGTTFSEIGKLYDLNGNLASRVSKAYDLNGNLASQVFSSEVDAFADLGGFGSASVGYHHNGMPYAGPPITFGDSSSFPNSYFGSIIWSNAKASVENGQIILLTTTTPTTFTTCDTNLANGARHLGELAVVLSPTKISIAGVADCRLAVANDAAAIYSVINGYALYYGSAVTTTSPAGTYTATVTVSGDYYIGVFLTGYDARVTSKPSVSALVIQ